MERGLVRVLPCCSRAATEVTVDPAPDTRPACSPPTFTLIYVVAPALALAILFVGFYRLGKDDTDAGWTMLAAGGTSLVLVAVTWPLALTINAARRASRLDGDGAATGVSERVDKVLAQLKLIADQQLISDRAKHVAFRDKDRDAVRR